MQIDTILFNIYTHNSMSFIQQTQHWLFQLLYESTKCSLSSLENANRKELEINHASPKARTRSIDNTINQNKAFDGVFPVCKFADKVMHRKRTVCCAAVGNCNEMWIWCGFERKNACKVQLNETPEGARKAANHSSPNLTRLRALAHSSGESLKITHFTVCATLVS